MADVNEGIVSDAHKFLFLVKSYPEKDLDEVISLFQQQARLDTDCAIWYCLDMEWFHVVHSEEEREVPNEKGKLVKKKVPVRRAKVHGGPDAWNFGTDIDKLQARIMYMFYTVNMREEDIEENLLSIQLRGYAPHNTLVALRDLLDRGVLHEYELEDGENKYIFYALKVNAGKNWGTKQFKTDPLTGKKNKKNGKGK